MMCPFALRTKVYIHVFNRSKNTCDYVQKSVMFTQALYKLFRCPLNTFRML